MNLTFYENNKQSKNSSFSPLQKMLIFPSIFSKFETEKNFTRDSFCLKLAKSKIFLPNYKNIKQEMDKIKKQFRNYFDIKNTIFKDMLTKKNSTTYQNFIRGFGKYFFGPFGIVTQKNKFLREYYFSRSALNVKIYAGRLEYYDYINKYNRYLQRKNNANKRLLSISKNYAIVNEKNDLFSMRAMTSKRLVKGKKNYVSLNRQKYRPSLTEITEIKKFSKFKKKKNNTFNKSFNNKIKDYKTKNENNNKLKNNPLGYLKTYSNFYSKKKRNMLENYKKAVSNIRNNNKIDYNISNTEKTRANTHINIKIKSEQVNNRNNSNFFLTQGSFSNNKYVNNKITFNRINNFKREKKSLSKFHNQINLKNISFKT